MKGFGEVMWLRKERGGDDIQGLPCLHGGQGLGFDWTGMEE